MILVAIGSNLTGPAGPPLAMCEAAVAALAGAGASPVRRSRWYESASIPLSAQPWYINGIISVATALEPVGLLALLHAIEVRWGRVRGAANAARVLDLDLLDYDGLIRPGPEPPHLPHPRMAGRAFVLLPLSEIAPAWRHPGSGRALQDLVRALPLDGQIRPL
jgi:2-amino-4-hydroxy-6-hydroxymethyldihydropteridine diphosphokinase